MFLDNIVATLQVPDFQLAQGEDLKNHARKLNETEYVYTTNQLGYISLNSQLNLNEVKLAVAFQYEYNGAVFQVGELVISTHPIRM